jgi:hypothetical protein
MNVASWLALAALHVVPGLVLFSPSLTARLYGVEPTGQVALLLRHRGALFFGVVCVCLWGLIDPSSRRLASALVAWSMLSFLGLYLGAGRPAGALEKIAWLDLLGLIPLAVVLHSVWWARPNE